jgi:hypothetical protein
VQSFLSLIPREKPLLGNPRRRHLRSIRARQ